jgi:DNA-binding transcriptional ArsR family regulator
MSKNSEENHMDPDAVHKALASPVRRDILLWLKTPEVCFPNQTHSFDHGVCASQIDERCGLSQSAVSSHLAVLQRAGLVKARRSGQWIFFKRDEAAIAAFLHYMNHDL